MNTSTPRSKQPKLSNWFGASGNSNIRDFSIESQVSPIPPRDSQPVTPAGVKRQLSSKRTESLTTMTSIEGQSQATDSEPSPRRPRTDQSQLAVVETIAEAAAGCAAVVVEGVKVVPHKIPAQKSDMTKQGETRRVNGALGAIHHQARMSESGWDHRYDTNSSQYKDQDSVGYGNNHNDTLSEAGDLGENYGAGYMGQLDDQAEVVFSGNQEVALPDPAIQSPSTSPVPLSEQMQEALNNFIMKSLTDATAVVTARFGKMEQDLQQVGERLVTFDRNMQQFEGVVQGVISDYGHQADAVAEVHDKIDQMTQSVSSQFAQNQEVIGQLVARIAALETQVGELRSAPAQVAAQPAAQGGQFDERETRRLRDAIKFLDAQDSKYWRSTLLIRDSRGERSERRVSFNQARQKLRQVGLAYLMDDCDTSYVTNHGDIRVTFHNPPMALEKLQQARRTLARNQVRHIRLETCVPPQFVAKKRDLRLMGSQMKANGMCENYDIVMKDGDCKLRTWSRANGVQFHDCSVPVERMEVDQEAVQTADCAICLEPMTPDQDRLKLKQCRHVFHMNCIQSNMMKNGLSCPLCRNIFEFPSESVDCNRCQLQNGEVFHRVDYCVATCGHVHRRRCQEEFLMQFGIPMEGVTTNVVANFNSHHRRKCYQCSETSRLRWVNICADLLRGGAGGARPRQQSRAGAETNTRRHSTQRQDGTSNRQGEQNTSGRISTIVTNRDPPASSNANGETINSENNVNILTIN